MQGDKALRAELVRFLSTEAHMSLAEAVNSFPVNDMKVRPPMTINERGLAEWDDEAAAFKQTATIDMKSPLIPQGLRPGGPSTRR